MNNRDSILMLSCRRHLLCIPLSMKKWIELLVHIVRDIFFRRCARFKNALGPTFNANDMKYPFSASTF